MRKNVLTQLLQRLDHAHAAPEPMADTPPIGFTKLEPAILASHRRPLTITSDVYEIIASTVGALPAETGAMLGGRAGTGVVSKIHLDRGAHTTTHTFTPDVAALNRVIAEWEADGHEFLGFVHSHPSGFTSPSGGDRDYAARILDAVGCGRLLMPIVQSAADTGTFDMSGFVATATIGGAAIHPVPIHIVHRHRSIAALDDPAFARVTSAYDLAATGSTRLVVVGVGGAASWCDAMARTGVSEIVLIDPDSIEPANVGTQQVFRRDVGRPKVDAVAERIIEINPAATVVAMQARIEDLDDDAVAALVRGPLPGSTTIPPGHTILCAFTDQFAAQARCNVFALHLGVPLVAAQMHELGRSCEVAFHVPGRSTACCRCVLGTRYRAYADGYQNTVGSAGTPYFAGERLNALAAMVTTAIIHDSGDASIDHPATIRFSRLLDRIATRNLALVKIDGDLAAIDDVVGNDALDTTVFVPQEPENPATGFPFCPDCGGTGETLGRRP